MFEQLFSRKTSQWLFQLNMSVRSTPKKLLKRFLKWFTSVEKPTSTRYKLGFFLVSSRNKPCLFEKHSALISTLFFHVPFWPRKYKKYKLFIISSLVDRLIRGESWRTPKHLARLKIWKGKPPRLNEYVTSFW